MSTPNTISINEINDMLKLDFVVTILKNMQMIDEDDEFKELDGKLTFLQVFVQRTNDIDMTIPHVKYSFHRKLYAVCYILKKLRFYDPPFRNSYFQLEEDKTDKIYLSELMVDEFNHVFHVSQTLNMKHNTKKHSS